MPPVADGIDSADHFRPRRVFRVWQPEQVSNSSSWLRAAILLSATEQFQTDSSYRKKGRRFLSLQGEHRAWFYCLMVSTFRIEDIEFVAKPTCISAAIISAYRRSWRSNAQERQAVDPGPLYSAHHCGGCRVWANLPHRERHKGASV